MRNLKKIASVALASIVCFAAAQAATIVPSKNYVTKVVKVPTSFTGLRTNTSIDIEYTVGPQKVELYAPDNLAPYVKVSVSRGTLAVGYTENMNIHGSHKTRLIVSAPDVTNFTTSSAGDITVKSNLNTKNSVELTVNSAGDITTRNLKAPAVTISTRSAGDISVGEISADKVFLTVNSAGDITSGQVKAQVSASLIVNSAGDIEVPSVIASDNLTLQSNSSGDVKVKEASADNVNLSSSSSGDVKVSNLTAINATLTCNSAGDIKVSGICSMADLSTNSTGDIDAAGLKATSVRATVRSLGEITCCAVDSLEAYHKGSGTIRYAGNPAHVTVAGHSLNEGVLPL